MSTPEHGKRRSRPFLGAHDRYPWTPTDGCGADPLVKGESLRIKNHLHFHIGQTLDLIIIIILPFKEKRYEIRDGSGEEKHATIPEEIHEIYTHILLILLTFLLNYSILLS